jgi:hypothetical protein
VTKKNQRTFSDEAKIAAVAAEMQMPRVTKSVREDAISQANLIDQRISSPPADCACPEHQRMMRNYESALRESTLYKSGGAASMQQAHRYKEKADAASEYANKQLQAHVESCPACRN